MTAQLRDVEEKGLVSRKVYAEVPPRVEYSLTEPGKSLKLILDAMWTWSRDIKYKTVKEKRGRLKVCSVFLLDRGLSIKFLYVTLRCISIFCK